MTQGPSVTYSRARAGWVLFLLAATYANNYADRSILNVLAQLIKTELNVSDTQLGLLSGLSFALFYALFGYPLARLSERVGRVNVISACVVLWSTMTALCGTAVNFSQLMAFRFGVGVGESGLAAPAHSIISDYYPASRRTSAIALFSIGVPIGALLGSISSGWLAQHYGWRAAFVAISVPGFLLAPLLWLTIKEPVRGNWDANRTIGAPTPSLRDVLRRQFETATFRHFCAGTVVTTVAGSGVAFIGAYFVRRFHVDYTTVGLIMGLLIGVGAFLGIFLGGFVSDWLARGHKRWYALLPAITVLLATPVYLTGYLQTDWRVQLAIMMVGQTLVSMSTVPFYGVTQNLVPAPMRATAAAVIFFLINLIGNGFGPILFGSGIDRLTRRYFAGAGLGDYAEACGRGGAHLAPGPLADACHTALADGTRWGLAVGTFAFLWAALHFYLASRTMQADLQAAEARH